MHDRPPSGQIPMAPARRPPIHSGSSELEAPCRFARRWCLPPDTERGCCRRPRRSRRRSLPLVDKPIIQYTVEEAVAAGITQVCIVTAASKRAVEDHFDRSLELEIALREKGDLARLAEIQRVSDLADIVYVRQKEQKGIGHAVLQAKETRRQRAVPADVPRRRDPRRTFPWPSRWLTCSRRTAVR